MRVSLIILIFSLFFSVSVFGQGREELRSRMDTVVHPVLSGENVLQFDKKSIHLGKVYDNAGEISTRFLFCNSGKKKVVIQDITTSCSCLEAKYDRTPIAPGEDREIVLIFNPRNFSSDVEVSACLYTDFSGRHPSNRLSVRATVLLSDKWRHLPCKVGDLRLKRKKLVIGDVGEDNFRKERILCANAGTRPLKVTAKMLPSYAAFECDPEIIPPGSEADLWILIDGKKISSIRDRTRPVRFDMFLQGVGGSMASRMIEVVVQPIDK